MSGKRKTDDADGPPDRLLISSGFIERSPLPMVMVQGTRHIVRFVNPAFRRLVGLVERENDELIGIPIEQAVPESGSCLPLLDKIYRTGVPATCVHEGHIGPRPFTWSIALWPVLDQHKRPVRIVIQITDITETALFREQATAMGRELMLSSVRQHELNEELVRREETLRMSKRLSDAVNSINEVIHSSLDVNAIMQKAIAEAAHAIEADGSFIGLFQENSFVIKHIYNMPGELKERCFHPEEVKGVFHAGSVGHAVAVNDVSADERINASFWSSFGVLSMLIAPLAARGKNIGAMIFCRTSAAFAFTQVHLDFVDKLSSTLFFALENARLYDALRENRAQLDAILQNAPAYIYMLDSDIRFIYANRAYEEALGLRNERLGGRSLYEVYPSEVAASFEANSRKVLQNGTRMEFEESVHMPDGKHVYTSIKAPLLDASEKPYAIIGISVDITERKRLEEEITHMARHDPLTGLPNRRMFREVADLEIAQARRHGTRLAIFFMDLDRFKEVNDTLGHDIGDLLLQETTARLKAVTRTSDTIARIGGDEFNLVISDISRPEYASEVAHKILAAIRKPFTIKGHELNQSTSIGISMFPDDGEKLDELLHYADMALYYAKEHGRNMFQYYSSAINTRSLERAGFQNALRQAIARDELRLYFQPLVDIKTKKVMSVEALLRWQHPEQGVLLPGQFFGAAADVRLMPEIERWVLKNVGKQVREWLHQGISPPCVTVNISAEQFQHAGLADRISMILGETGLRPECIDIEITESTAMQNIENTIQQMEKLRNAGIQISIDDFGTGCFSLNYLKRLPVRKLKIDRSFVRDLAGSAEDRKMVRAVLLLAHSLDLKVVAVGVEDKNQLRFLHSLECDEAQGNLFCEPLTPEKIKELIAA